VTDRQPTPEASSSQPVAEADRLWVAEGCRIAAVAYLEREIALSPRNAGYVIGPEAPRFMLELAKVLSPEVQTVGSLLTLINNKDSRWTMDDCPGYLKTDYCDGTVPNLRQGWYWRSSIPGIAGGWSTPHGPFETREAAIRAGQRGDKNDATGV
jgi:hypothetical protein